MDGHAVHEGEGMKVADLQIYGIPGILIKSWQENVGEELLPMQEMAVRDYGLMDDCNLIISAPTSSGKTFCGEMAMARALANGRKVICLVPLKALAEERYRDFRRKYDSLGLRTIISTSDRKEFDRKFIRGDFDLAVIIFEKLNQILTRNLDVLGYIDLILVDELQMIGDESRGAVLEQTLLKILHSKYKCRLIGLSAVLSGVGRLSEWMNAKLFAYGHRPVDLYQGILWKGEYSYRKKNSGEQGSERIVEDTELLPEEQLIEAVRTLVEKGERVLIFLKSKAACHHFALLLAEKLDCSGAEETIVELNSISKTELTEPLIDLLAQGTAFHHADLSFEQRNAIEDGYRKNEIRALFATTTLSMGLNLPATTVFLEPFKFSTGNYAHHALPQHLSWPEYENMCGRAGRLKYADKPGKAILLVNSEFEREVIWSKFIEGRPADLCGQLYAREIADIVLDLVSSGCCQSIAEIKETLAKSFSGELYSFEKIEKAVESYSNSMWIESNNGILTGTALGSTIAAFGISGRTAERLISLLKSGTPPDAVQWMYEFLCSPEIERSSYSARGRAGAERIEELRQGLHSEESSLFRLNEILSNPELMDQAAVSRIGRALAVSEWCHGVGMMELENSYYIPAGGLLNISELCAWLAESCGAFARILDLPKPVQALFKRMAFSLRYGIEPELRPLWKALKNIVSRDELYALSAHGIRTAKGLFDRSGEELEKILGAVKTDEIMKLIENKMSQRNSKEDKMNGSQTYKLILEGRSNRDRLTVKFFGRELPLTLKSFKYLAKLACAKYLNHGENGWLHKDDLEPGFNQARYIYNLKKELGLSKNQSVLENNRSGYYRLNLNPEEIVVNLDNLKEIQDFELKTIAEKYENLQFS